MDIFKDQLSFGEIMSMELPLLSDLYTARIKYSEDKRKIEQKELEKEKSRIKSQKPSR